MRRADAQMVKAGDFLTVDPLYNQVETKGWRRLPPRVKVLCGIREEGGAFLVEAVKGHWIWVNYAYLHREVSCGPAQNPG